jgi:Ca2+-binding EF-hand superfamily protein
MKANWILSALAASLLACLLTVHAAEAAGPPVAPAAEKPGQDIQDLVFFADHRPVLVRLHVRVDGKAFTAAWEGFIDRVFKYCDKNGDGFLNKAEAASIPPIAALFGGGFGPFGRFGGGPPTLAMLDTNKDGKVSRQELADYYRRNGAGPFHLNYQGEAGANAARLALDLNGVYGFGGGARQSKEGLNKKIFELLDKNRDGKLSRAELAAAAKIFAKLDTNDDEMITTGELLGQMASSGSGLDFAVVNAIGDFGTGQADAGASPFHVIQSNRPDPALARRLLGKYAGKNKTLSAKALGLDGAAFAKLDIDRDGQLDAEELARFALRAPDIGFTVNIGQQGAKIAVGKGGPLAKLTTVQNGFPILEFGNNRLELSGPERTGSGIMANFVVDNQYRQQFKAADTDNNGYIDRAEANRSPFFRDLFSAMDRDGDGKVFEKEMLAYFKSMDALARSARDSVVSMSIHNKVGSLFDMVDTDGDGRLSVRELRQMPGLIKKLDKKGDGYIRLSDIPRGYSAHFSRGRSAAGFQGLGGVFVLDAGGGPTQPIPDRKAGPLWFRKMDRNRDGDVSRREFLGTDEEFKKIDTDGDGLISLQEAEAYDRLKRQGKQKNEK